MGNNWVFRKIRLQCTLTFSLTKQIQMHWAVTFRRSNKTCPCVRKRLWRQNRNNKPLRVSRIFIRPGSVKSSIPNFNIKNSKLIPTAGRVIGKIKKENKNKMVNYICPIFSTAQFTTNAKIANFTSNTLPIRFDLLIFWKVYRKFQVFEGWNCCCCRSHFSTLFVV